MGATNPHRVAVWATGGIGTIAIPTILRRSDLELVGVWVHSPDKVGRDVGELVGLDPVGLTASNDVDELLGRGVDCVYYAASGPERDAAAVPDYLRLLSAGVNVVTVSTPPLVYPPGYSNQAWVADLEAAAERGGVTFYSSGIEPGFAADQLPLVLATQSSSIRSIRCSEIFLYDQYPVAFMMRDVMGFGMPMDYAPLLATPEAQSGAWGPSIRLVAAGLGIELDGLREQYDRVPAHRQIETASGVIEPGTCGAIRAQTIGVVDGRDVITIEHVNRMAPDLAPEWPSGHVDGTYRIEIDGDPVIRCDLVLGEPGGANDAAMCATAMRTLNAIPYVVAAPPGLVTSLDLPLTLPQDPLVP
jgi:hypothetical protein